MSYNIDEILAMAEQIERNGAAFYTAGARLARDPEVSKLMAELASWEQGHESLFSRMRERLAKVQPAQPDPEGQADLYLSALADRHVFGPDKAVEAVLTGSEDAAAILDLALRFEADSINFFAAMKSLIPAGQGADQVDALIREELGHVAYIERARRRFLDQG